MRPDRFGTRSSFPGALYISASTGENVEKLLLRVESELEAARRRYAC